MPDTILSWLDGVGATAFTLASVAFVAINAIAIAVVFFTRDRSLVNRWTPLYLATNLILVGAGLGVPLAAMAARAVITAVTPSFLDGVPRDAAAQGELEASRPTR